MSSPIVSFDEQAVKDELRELVRKTIEETINAMLDEEADQLVGAAPYEQTDERTAYRAGYYERGITTTSGQVTLRMPKPKGTESLMGSMGLLSAATGLGSSAALAQL